jgi:hypothetical protein
MCERESGAKEKPRWLYNFEAEVSRGTTPRNKVCDQQNRVDAAVAKHSQSASPYKFPLTIHCPSCTLLLITSILAVSSPVHFHSHTNSRSNFQWLPNPLPPLAKLPPRLLPRHPPNRLRVQRARRRHLPSQLQRPLVRRRSVVRSARRPTHHTSTRVSQFF